MTYSYKTKAIYAHDLLSSDFHLIYLAFYSYQFTSILLSRFDTNLEQLLTCWNIALPLVNYINF